MAKNLSKDPGKQRKRLYTAPAHARHRRLSAPLSPELSEKHRTNSLPIKKGDTVVVMRGDYEEMEGKVTRVDPRNNRVYIEGVTREKADGSTLFAPIHPSKVMIKGLDLNDRWRREILERRAATKPSSTEGEMKGRIEEER